MNMVTIKKHKNMLEDMLMGISSEDRKKFGAWCCFPFTKSESIFKFLAPFTEKEFHKKIENLIEKIWRNEIDERLVRSWQNDIDSIEWDEDAVADNQESAHQGAVDLLAALSFLMKSFFEHNSASSLSACAENIINRIDYIGDFSENDDESDLIKQIAEREFENQTKFINDLMTRKNNGNNLEKYHDEVNALFSKTNN